MPQDTLHLLVKSVRQSTPEIRLYELVSPDGEDLPAFTAGAHVDLHLANGIVRSYSIASSQDDRSRYLVGIARDRQSRGGSSFIHDTLAPGDMIEVSLPRNHFALHEEAPSSILIAGGIGVTPIMSMVRRLGDLGREWKLHLATRSRNATPFLNELAAGDPARTFLHFDDENGGRPIDIRAVVDAAAPGSHFYCCGPTPMLEAFKAAVAGIPEEHVHFEHFSGTGDAATDGGFDVELARSGKVVRVEKGQTILDAVGAVGVAVPFSCQAGVCGSCETRVVAGLPDHRDLILTETERQANKSMMICCSGALSDRLVLDL